MDFSAIMQMEKNAISWDEILCPIFIIVSSIHLNPSGCYFDPRPFSAFCEQ